jgi:hypothetical protein
MKPITRTVSHAITSLLFLLPIISVHAEPKHHADAVAERRYWKSGDRGYFIRVDGEIVAFKTIQGIEKLKTVGHLSAEAMDKLNTQLESLQPGPLVDTNPNSPPECGVGASVYTIRQKEGAIIPIYTEPHVRKLEQPKVGQIVTLMKGLATLSDWLIRE